MIKEEAVSLLRLIVRAEIELSQDKLSKAMYSLQAAHGLAQNLSKVSEEDLIEASVPVCICEDGRGWSTCGGKCAYHPPEYICLCGGCGNCALVGFSQGCVKRVAYMKMCHKCDPEP